MRKLNTEIASRINRSLVLTHIHENPNISRAELARLTGMDRSTITHILNYLIQEQIVAECAKGQASAQGGRRPIQLSVRYDARSLVAIEINLQSITCAVTNLNGVELGRATRPLTRGAALIQNLTKALEQLRKESPKAFDRTAAIGISCPGIVNIQEGVVIVSDYHSWRNVDVRTSVSEQFGKPVFLENDANAAARGELRHLGEEDVSSLLYLYVRESPPGHETLLGVGGALIIDDKVWHGAHFHAGEMAHQINRFFHKSNLAESELLREHVALFDNSLEFILRAADDGDARAQQLVEAIVDHIANALCQLEAFLDPKVIMVFVDEGKERFVELIEQGFWKFYWQDDNRTVKFLKPRLRGEAVMKGMIDLLQEKVFVPDTSHISLLFS